MPGEGTDHQDADSIGATPPPTLDSRPQTEATGDGVIHLGGNRRSGEGHDVGELSYSQTAYGLTALGRAQARTQRRAGPSSSVGPVFGRSRRARRLRRRRHTPRRDRLRSRGGVHRSPRQGRLFRTVLVAVIAAAVIAIAAAVLVGVQLSRPVPRPVLGSALPAARTLPGAIPRLPWPASAESAVALQNIGMVGEAGPALPVPIASLAKVMTALVLLRDHPLSSGQSGPQVPITPEDQAIYQADQAAGDSVAPVVAGETLSELQLLEGLLIPSADNLASVVAQWDAGTQERFVAKMNATAAAFGMHATHYADPSGVSASTVSTAADQLRLAEVAAANPVLMSIVRQPQLVFPEATQLLDNYNTFIGQDGIVGIKTGDTSAAGGCFMFAAQAYTDGHVVQVLGAVLGVRRTPLIESALQAGESLIRPSLATLRPVTALAAGTVVAYVTDAWGQAIPVSTVKPVTILHVGPTPVRLAVAASGKPVAVGLPSGSHVATVTVDAAGQVQTVAAVTDRPITGPSRRWRIERL